MIFAIPVTLHLDLGTPPHVVREVVGHSAIDVTMTIYAHVSLDEKRKALGKLGEALRLCSCCHRRCQWPDRHAAGGASPQFRGGGQGRGRTADLPLFRNRNLPVRPRSRLWPCCPRALSVLNHDRLRKLGNVTVGSQLGECRCDLGAHPRRREGTNWRQPETRDRGDASGSSESRQWMPRASGQCAKWNLQCPPATDVRHSSAN
jgi:hypothetical protein